MKRSVINQLAPPKKVRKLTRPKQLPDSIPQDLKTHFYTGKQKPNLMKDYDALGFDTDHCLVKYNVKALVELVVRGHLEELIAMGYSNKLTDINKSENTIFFNNAVWDVQNGTILKLGLNKEILDAWIGTKKMTQDQILEKYGDPPLFKVMQWPDKIRELEQEEGAYWIMLGYTDCCKVPIISLVTQLIIEGHIQKTYLQFAYDLANVSYNQFKNYNQEEVFPLSTFGRFYPEVFKNPEKYIQPQPQLRETLEELKRKGKKLFLLSNTHVQYTDLTLKTTLGENWKEIFEIWICDTRRPLFQKGKAPFLRVDFDNKNGQGEPIAFEEQILPIIEDDNINCFLQGNATQLTDLLKLMCKKDQIKVAFFGDNYLSDLQATNELNKTLEKEGSKCSWDAFAIIEEISYINSTYEEGVSPQLYPYDGNLDKYSYFIKSSKSETKKNFFISEMEKVTRYALPFVKNIKIFLSSEFQIYPTEAALKKDIMAYAKEINLEGQVQLHDHVIAERELMAHAKKIKLQEQVEFHDPKVLEKQEQPKIADQQKQVKSFLNELKQETQGQHQKPKQKNTETKDAQKEQKTTKAKSMKQQVLTLLNCKDKRLLKGPLQNQSKFYIVLLNLAIDDKQTRHVRNQAMHNLGQFLRKNWKPKSMEERLELEKKGVTLGHVPQKDKKYLRENFFNAVGYMQSNKAIKAYLVALEAMIPDKLDEWFGLQEFMEKALNGEDTSFRSGLSALKLCLINYFKTEKHQKTAIEPFKVCIYNLNSALKRLNASTPKDFTVCNSLLRFFQHLQEAQFPVQVSDKQLQDESDSDLETTVNVTGMTYYLKYTKSHSIWLQFLKKMLVIGKGTLKDKASLISFDLFITWQEMVTRLGDESQLKKNILQLVEMFHEPHVQIFTKSRDENHPVDLIRGSVNFLSLCIEQNMKIMKEFLDQITNYQTIVILMAQSCKQEASHFKTEHKDCIENGKCVFNYELRQDLVNLTQRICRYNIGQQAEHEPYVEVQPGQPQPWESNPKPDYLDTFVSYLECKFTQKEQENKDDSFESEALILMLVSLVQDILTFPDLVQKLEKILQDYVLKEINPSTVGEKSVFLRQRAIQCYQIFAKQLVLNKAHQMQLFNALFTTIVSQENEKYKETFAIRFSAVLALASFFKKCSVDKAHFKASMDKINTAVDEMINQSNNQQLIEAKQTIFQTEQNVASQEDEQIQMDKTPEAVGGSPDLQADQDGDVDMIIPPQKASLKELTSDQHFPGYDKIGINTHGDGPTEFEIDLQEQKNKKIEQNKKEKKQQKTQTRQEEVKNQPIVEQKVTQQQEDKTTTLPALNFDSEDDIIMDFNQNSEANQQSRVISKETQLTSKDKEIPVSFASKHSQLQKKMTTQNPPQKKTKAKTPPKRVKMPKKRHYRTRAHINPFNERCEKCPQNPRFVDWKKVYPWFYKQPTELQEKMFIGTDKHPVKFETEFKGENALTQTPSILDIGCGYGGLMFKLTEYYSKDLIFGMEIRGKVSNFVADKTIATRINSDFTQANNIGLVRTNSMKSLHNFIPPNSVENVFICFADPHFKARNKRRRIITEALLTDYAYVMKPGALLYCVTDVEDLHKDQVEKLKNHPMFEKRPKHKSLSFCERMIRYHTDEAQKVKSKKGKVWHAVYRKIKLTDYNDAVKCVDKINTLFGTTKENLPTDVFATEQPFLGDSQIKTEL